jgi:hypothetical protein
MGHMVLRNLLLFLTVECHDIVDGFQCHDIVDILVDQFGP